MIILIYSTRAGARTPDEVSYNSLINSCAKARSMIMIIIITSSSSTTTTTTTTTTTMITTSITITIFCINYLRSFMFNFVVVV